jgi:hypothetical protein
MAALTVGASRTPEAPTNADSELAHCPQIAVRYSGLMPNDGRSELPANCEVIEVHVGELKQLFKAIDPSPFREKDLDANAEEFIVTWAREAHGNSTLGLVVYVDRAGSVPDEAAIVGDAIREFFRHRSQTTRDRLRQLFRVGRTSLLIGISFLAASLLIGDFVESVLRGQRIGELLREGLLIGGWVAMWRPLQIFLYDWWPIRSEARLYDRLSIMPVRIAHTRDASSASWRWDWPTQHKVH